MSDESCFRMESTWNYIIYKNVKIFLYLRLDETEQ